jgi:hypothetical protein
LAPGSEIELPRIRSKIGRVKVFSNSTLAFENITREY